MNIKNPYKRLQIPYKILLEPYQDHRAVEGLRKPSTVFWYLLGPQSETGAPFSPTGRLELARVPRVRAQAKAVQDVLAAQERGILQAGLLLRT